MAWTERQQRLLAAMGLRLWSPPVSEAPGPDAMGAQAMGAQAVAAEVLVADALASLAPAGHTAGAAGAAVAAEAAAVRTPRPPLTAPAPSSAPRPSPAPAPATALTAPPGAGALAGLGWPELREAAAGCRACSMCGQRTQPVLGSGHPQAAWLVVGETPGELEDREGEPFAGAAGELLDRMLAALALTRAADGDTPRDQRAYLAHVLKCQPSGSRVAGAAEFANCEPFLVRQIELLRPRIVLAMGRLAVKALLRSDEPLGRLRGRVHRYQGLPLIVTYEPSYLLRHPAEKAKAWDDLCLAAEVLEQQPQP